MLPLNESYIALVGDIMSTLCFFPLMENKSKQFGTKPFLPFTSSTQFFNLKILTLDPCFHLKRGEICVAGGLWDNMEHQQNYIATHYFEQNQVQQYPCLGLYYFLSLSELYYFPGCVLTLKGREQGKARCSSNHIAFWNSQPKSKVF